VTVKIGTPPQTFSLVADTGSDDVIVQSCICKLGGFCPGEFGRCFKGSNKSSSFVMEGQNKSDEAHVVQMTFGSGDIVAVEASDQVSVGLESAFMNNSLLLMVRQKLELSGQFEGILGLGRPHRDELSMLQTSPKRYPAPRLWSPGDSAEAEPLMKMPGFLEEAGVSRFSMCFNAKEDGVLRLNAPKAQNAMGSVGNMHWGLDFQGISVGGASKPVKFCSPESKKHGQETACGIIPDSGTTMIMGPQDQINKLFEELCDGWERCRKFHGRLAEQVSTLQQHRKLGSSFTKRKEEIPPELQDIFKELEDAFEAAVGEESAGDDASYEPKKSVYDDASYEPQKAASFQLLLQQCGSWAKSSNLNDEMPSLFFRVAGKTGGSDVLELKPDSYVGEMPLNSQTTELGCVPLFGEMDYPTELNGPVWIFGTPLFYQFQVHYDREPEPPTVSFLREPCGTCVDGRPLNQTASLLSRQAEKSLTQGSLRRIMGLPRQPEIDTSKPL